MRSSRNELWAGIRTELPIALSTIPFGIIFGVLALQAGIPPLVAQAMSSVVFAGSAQFIGAGMIGDGDPMLIIWLTTLIINIRHLLYSATLAPYAEKLSLGWKVVLSYLLTDEAFVPTALHYQEEPAAPKRHWYWFGAGITLWTCWQLGTLAGILIGDQLPPSLAWLDFALIVTFIGMIVPVLRDRPMVGAFVAAGLAAVLTNALPFPIVSQYKLPILVGAIAGIAAGVFLEAMLEARQSTP